MPITIAVLGALTGDHPTPGIKINLRPPRPGHVAAPLRRQDQDAEERPPQIAHHMGCLPDGPNLTEGQHPLAGLLFRCPLGPGPDMLGKVAAFPCPPAEGDQRGPDAVGSAQLPLGCLRINGRLQVVAL
ncbi:MAG: hypothetical protein IIB72_02610 [Proteobacteria bacterium]|nr:hypothetical protein [Pseudomonadota bacterium]